MKRKKQLVLIALFLSALLGASLATTQPARADLSCELQLWEDFLNANFYVHHQVSVVVFRPTRWLRNGMHTSM